jgi:hypothetical protein
MQSPGGAGKTAGIGDDNQGLQLSEVHRTFIDAKTT